MTTPLLSPQEAYLARNPEASIIAHKLKEIRDHDEPTLSTGPYVKPMVFGGLDGISTIFAFVSGSVGAQISIVHVVAIGFANLVAGAFAMGFGEYVSASAEIEVARREYAREEWEVDNYVEGEIKEVVDDYMTKGMIENDAVEIVNILSKYKSIFVEHMMLNEIKMFPAEDGDEGEARNSAIAMFLSFFIFGSIPLLSYLIFTGYNVHGAFYKTGLMAIFALFLLGFVKSKLVGSAAIRGGLLMALQGFVSGAVSFFLGDWLQGFLTG